MISHKVQEQIMDSLNPNPNNMSIRKKRNKISITFRRTVSSNLSPKSNYSDVSRSHNHKTVQRLLCQFYNLHNLCHNLPRFPLNFNRSYKWCCRKIVFKFRDTQSMTLGKPFTLQSSIAKDETKSQVALLFSPLFQYSMTLEQRP